MFNTYATLGIKTYAPAVYPSRHTVGCFTFPVQGSGTESYADLNPNNYSQGTNYQEPYAEYGRVNYEHRDVGRAVFSSDSPIDPSMMLETHSSHGSTASDERLITESNCAGITLTETPSRPYGSGDPVDNFAPTPIVLQSFPMHYSYDITPNTVTKDTTVLQESTTPQEESQGIAELGLRCQRIMPKTVSFSDFLCRFRNHVIAETDVSTSLPGRMKNIWPMLVPNIHHGLQRL